MKVTILIFCLYDLYYVNIKHEKLGDDSSCPTVKNCDPITCGRMDAVMKDFFLI